MCMLLLMLELWLTHFSFTSLFAEYIWPFLFMYKIIGITLENIIEMKLGDKCMMSPISSTIGVVENLTTFGAPEFKEFLLSWLIGLGILFGERFYLVVVADYFVGWSTDSIEKLKDFWKKLMGGNEDEDQDSDVEDKEGEEKDSENSESDDEEAIARKKMDSEGSDIL
jgi:hypothetical protein